jgi:peptide/nickel transport system permease protein
MNRMPSFSTFSRSDAQGVAGLTIVALIVTASLLAPVIAPYRHGELVGEVWGPLSAAAPLGYDNLGRDMLSRLLLGGQITLLIALAGTALAFIIGCCFGLVSAIAGGWVDAVIARSFDAFMSLPPLIFALVLLSVLGTSIPILIATLAMPESSASAVRLAVTLSHSTILRQPVSAKRVSPG